LSRKGGEGCSPPLASEEQESSEERGPNFFLTGGREGKKKKKRKFFAYRTRKRKEGAKDTKKRKKRREGKGNLFSYFEKKADERTRKKTENQRKMGGICSLLREEKTATCFVRGRRRREGKRSTSRTREGRGKKDGWIGPKRERLQRRKGKGGLTLGRGKKGGRNRA